MYLRCDHKIKTFVWLLIKIKYIAHEMYLGVNIDCGCSFYGFNTEHHNHLFLDLTCLMLQIQVLARVYFSL